jgi:DNA ligase-associated metallophosphoesterase
VDTESTTDACHLLPDGRGLHLLSERAAWLPEAGLLMVADVHFGKAASFRRLGVPVPQGTTEANLSRLDALLARLPGVRELVFLGDFLHAASGRAPATLQTLLDWRQRHAALELTLVRGNHDGHAGDPPADLGIQVVNEPWLHAGLALCHDPATPRPQGFTAVAGHLHPVTHLGRGFDKLRLACFHARGDGVLVLPAFGEFTGGAVVRPQAGDSLYLVTGDRVLPLPAPQRAGGAV